MSKLFYDHLIAFDEVSKVVNKYASSKEDKEEMWRLIDEMIHHKVLDCVLDNLPEIHHQEFLDKFNDSPHDEGLFDYLKDKIDKNIEELIKQEIGGLAYELLQDIKVQTKKA